MKRIGLLITTIMAAVAAKAIELPDIIGDNMILQQQADAKLWGWATAGNTVKVTTGWNGKSYTTKVNQDGKWMLTVATPEASYTKYDVTFEELGDAKSKKAIDTKTTHGVLIGEVWFCSGQSNMEMPVGGFWNCPVEGANEAIVSSIKYKDAIRVVTVSHDGVQQATERKEKVAGKWDICEPKNTSKFSACGYFFATTLVDALNIPVGIINCSWGGSCVEGWLPKEVLLTYPDGLTPMDDTPYHAKMVMFNGMINPLAGYTIKGFLWNQGESNVGKEKDYIERFSTMTRLWRKMWNQPNDKLPIYTVELPPYRYGNADGDWAAKFRSAQHEIAKTLENCGCVSTSDLFYPYEIDQIHGSKKKEIGQRLAYLALTRDYGVEGIGAEMPEFDYYETVEASREEQTVIAGSKVETPQGGMNVSQKLLHIYFTNCADGFDRLADIRGFEAQSSDGTWHTATVWASSAWQNVKRQGCFLCLACPEADEIKNIRYCYKNYIIGELHNMRGLPIVPFTTHK